MGFSPTGARNTFILGWGKEISTMQTFSSGSKFAKWKDRWKKVHFYSSILAFFVGICREAEHL
jgi:hypothetical protein